MVEEASATKATTQLFIEKVEQRYSIGMVAATVALFVVPLLLGAALQPTLLRAMTFMIVASPCAVVLATMPPLLSAIANAGRHGVLVKSAVVMEQLGAITARRLRQDRHPDRGHPAADRGRAARRSGLTNDDLLRWPRPPSTPASTRWPAPSWPPPPERGLRPTHGRATSPPPPARGVTRHRRRAPRRGRQPPAPAAGQLTRLGTRPRDRRRWTARKPPARPPSSSSSTAPRSGCSALADQLRPDAAATVAALTALTGTARCC